MKPTAIWLRLIIYAVCLWGVAIALPNAFYDRVEVHNDAAQAVAAAKGTASAEQKADLALWPGWLPSSLMPLGLDLRGGAHLLAQIKVEDVYADRINALWPEARDALRKARDEVGAVKRVKSSPDILRITISQPENMNVAVQAVEKLAMPIATLSGGGRSDLEVRTEGADLIIGLSEAEKSAIDDRTMQQSLEIIRNRIDLAGTREPTILRQGADRILIEVPGIGSAAELKSLIGTTAKLSFHPVAGTTTNPDQNPGARNMLVPSTEDEGLYYILEQTPVVTGEDLVDSVASFDQNGRPAVSFRFDGRGARAFGDYTAGNIGKLFAIVLDNKVISAPRIQSHIAGGSGIITGNFTVESANELAVLLRSGALPAEMEFLEERTIGPELGADSIRAGQKAAVIGGLAVVAYMVLSYGLFGWFANFALVLNIIIMVAVLSTIGATLTLPGIAGIVLTMGMAVDANVLIFERIREALRNGLSPGRACDEGFGMAMSAIIDANITGLLTAIIMFWIGSGPVRGFAVTLTLGILTSMFTAIFVTRLCVEVYINRRRPKTIVV